MTNELSFYFYAGLALIPTLIAFGVIWWRQNKQPSPLSVGKLCLVVLVTFVACFVSLVVFMLVANLSGFQSLDSFVQPFSIASGVVAYFIGNQVAVRLAKSVAK